MTHSLKIKLGVLLALFWAIASFEASAYDAPWNGGREDITKPGPEPENDCTSNECSCPGDGNTGSPVYTARGYLVWKDSDITFPSTTRVGLRRTYNSFDFRAGLFGRGWVTAQESNIARTYKAITEGNPNGSPTTATAYQSVPIWLASHGRRYRLEETATACTTPDVLYFTFEKLANGGFKQVYEDSLDYNIYSDTGALLESYSDKDGTTVYYEYDIQNRLSRQYDSFGFELNFTYNDQGFVSQVTDQGNRLWEYSYDVYGNLVQVLDPDGNTKDYGYRLVDNIGYKQHLLTDVNDNGDDPVLNVTWSEVTLNNRKAMRVSSYTESDGHRHDYSYAQTTYNGIAAIRTTKNTKQIGSNTTIESQTLIADAATYWILSRNNATTGTSQSSTYDARGKLIARTDERGNMTLYEYNQAGRKTLTTELAGTTDEKQIAISYFGNTDRIAVLNEYGLRETRYYYDSDLRILTKTQVDLGTSEERTWSYTYHPNTTDSQGNQILGKVASIDGPQPGVQDTIHLSYNAQGLITRIDQPQGQAISYIYNSVGQQISQTDSNGVLTEMFYDSRNRLVETRTNGRITSYAYNGQGQLIETADELGRSTTLAYDGYNQLSRITYPSGDYLSIGYIYASAYTEATRKYHKAGGVLVSTEILRNDPRTKLPIQEYLSSTNEQVNNQTYNGVDDLVQITLYGHFDGVAGSSTTNYTYDREGRVTQIADPDNGVTIMNYDDFERLTDVTDPNNGKTLYSFNAFDDLIQISSPDTGTSQYQFDPAGNLMQHTNANNVQVNYSYDALNRITFIDYEGNDLDATLTYDEGPFGIGRLTSAVDGSGSSQYQYDDRGLVTQADISIAGTSLSVGYGYNTAGEPIAINYPSGAQVNLNYDASGRLSRIQYVDNGNTTNLLENITWHAQGMASYQQGNGLVTELIYDTAGRLIEKRYGGIENRLQSQLDNQSQIIQQAWTRDGLQDNNAYQYDELGRLTQDGSADLVFGYDSVGNRLSKAKADGSLANTYTYDNNSNRLNQIDATSISRDAAGNTLSDATRQYQFNAMNRLAQVTHTISSTQASYSYNYKGERVRKQILNSPGLDVRFVYGQGGELLGEYDGNGNRIREYVYQSAGGVNELIAQVQADGTILYLHADHLATPRLATDQSKQIVWRWDSDAFGTTAAIEDPDNDGVVTVINLRYPGQYYDQESSLHYNYFRYYDPFGGRYISSDPIGLASNSPNTYTYVVNNPMSYSDTYGLEIDGRFAGININNIDITNIDSTLNPYMGDPNYGESAYVLAYATYTANIQVGLRIICAEFEETCVGKEMIRSWYPSSGMSLNGISGDFQIRYNPVSAIAAPIYVKLVSYSLAYIAAGKKARDTIHERLKNTYGSLNAFAKAVCIGTANLPAN